MLKSQQTWVEYDINLWYIFMSHHINASCIIWLKFNRLFVFSLRTELCGLSSIQFPVEYSIQIASISKTDELKMRLKWTQSMNMFSNTIDASSTDLKQSHDQSYDSEQNRFAIQKIKQFGFAAYFNHIAFVITITQKAGRLQRSAAFPRYSSVLQNWLPIIWPIYSAATELQWNEICWWDASETIWVRGFLPQFEQNSTTARFLHSVSMFDSFHDPIYCPILGAFQKQYKQWQSRIG